jgi:ATP-binding cassette subfamily B protein
MSSYATHSQSMHADEQMGMPSAAQTRHRIRYLATFVRPHKRMFAVALASNVGMTVFGVAIPLIFKHAIDRGLVPKDIGTAVFWVSLALLMVLLNGISIAVGELSKVFTFRVLNDLRVALFNHVQRQGMDFFETERTGRVISRLTNDVDALENLVSDGIYMVFSNLLTLTAIEFVMFYLNAELALWINAIFPVMLISTIVFRYYSTRAYRITRERLAIVTAQLAESLAGMRVLQSFAAEGRMAAEFEKTNISYRKANMKTIYQSATYFPGVELLSAIGTAIVLWRSGVLSAEGAAAFGTIFAFLNYVNDFFDPIQQLSQFYSSFLSAMAALDKIMYVMETTPTIVDAPDARTLAQVKGDVRFEHVNFQYSENTPQVLFDIDVHVNAGETVALVGRTGAGKSTFVKLLCRFYDPVAGTVRIDDSDLRDLDSSWLRRQLGIVPQEGFLFSTTVAENIRFGRPDATDEDVHAAARSVGADEFIEALHDGYETHVGERGTRLSAGQRQLVAFARAMLADPKLLVLDEATSSVDVATEMRLAEGLSTLVAGRTAFIVAHRLSTIRGADRILVVEAGRILEQGTHDDLIEQAGRYAELYGSWTAPDATIEEVLESR